MGGCELNKHKWRLYVWTQGGLQAADADKDADAVKRQLAKQKRQDGARLSPQRSPR